MDQKNTILDNIILDQSLIISGEENDPSGLILFSQLQPGAKPVVPHEVNFIKLEYPKLYSPKCAICNSPFRELLEWVYIDKNKKINTTIKWFEKHYNAKLNFAQVKQHVKHHCDFNKIETPGLLDYEGEEEKLQRWKYREYELAEIAILLELNDVKGIVCKNTEETFKRSMIIEKLTRQLILIKEKRDDNSLGLPNVFEVLMELHDIIDDPEAKRIIREKGRELKESL